jgi:hypothetical protein
MPDGLRLVFQRVTTGHGLGPEERPRRSLGIPADAQVAG